MQVSSAPATYVCAGLLILAFVLIYIGQANAKVSTASFFLLCLACAIGSLSCDASKAHERHPGRLRLLPKAQGEGEGEPLGWTS